MIGIYSITCLINQKKYIGQSNQIKTRWTAHKSNLREHTHCNCGLQHDYDLYGLDNFVFEIIELCPQVKLDEREKYWINYYDTYHNGYNLTPGGCGVSGEKNPMYGKSGKQSPRFIDMIYQLDSSGQIIAQYESANLAAKAVSGQAGHINDCLQTWKEHKPSPVGASHPERLTHKGFQWIFEKDYKLLQKYGYDFSKKRTKTSLTIKDLIDKGALSSDT